MKQHAPKKASEQLSAIKTVTEVHKYLRGQLVMKTTNENGDS